MSLVYRASWADAGDDRPGIDPCRRVFEQWALEGTGATAVEGEEMQFDRPDGRGCRTVRVADVSAEGLGDTDGVTAAWEGSVADESTDAPRTVWVTTVRVALTGSDTHICVENHVETEDVTRRVSVGRPRVVDGLVAACARPRLGNSLVRLDTVDVNADGIELLVTFLEDEARSLPVIVVSGVDDEVRAAGLARIADRITTRARGIATVVVLDADATRAFRDRLDTLAVWDGAIRVYAPGAPLAPSQAYRHRYYTSMLLESRESAVVDRILYAAATMSTRRPLHQVFTVFERQSSQRPTPLTPEAMGDGLVHLDQELELEELREELDSVHVQLNQAKGHLDRLRLALAERQIHTLFWETEFDPGDSVPDVVDDVDGAILAARAYLTDWLEIHDDAERELVGINTGAQAGVWGNTTWSGFRALAAYAEARSTGFTGRFWEWCDQGHPLAWPATTKKLSMTESESVRTNRKWAAARHLPVSTDVDPSGRVFMWAHLKIAEGGGDLAPRVYFYDDTRGETGKVHVGFVGPHHLMPNTRS